MSVHLIVSQQPEKAWWETFYLVFLKVSDEPEGIFFRDLRLQITTLFQIWYPFFQYF